MPALRTRLSLLAGSLGALALLSGCGGSSSTGADAISEAQSDPNWNHIAIQTIPDHEYTGPLGRSSGDESASGDIHIHTEQIGPSADEGRFAEARRTYQYYPSSEVYFDMDRSLYFWQAGPNQWESGDQLPSSIRLNSVEAETLRLRTAYPTRFHTKIRLAYPAGGMLTTVDSEH